MLRGLSDRQTVIAILAGLKTPGISSCALFREIHTLEESSDKLLGAQTVSRKAFGDTLRGKLTPLG